MNNIIGIFRDPSPHPGKTKITKIRLTAKRIIHIMGAHTLLWGYLIRAQAGCNEFA